METVIDAPQRVRAQFEAMLFEPVLQPMASAFGPYADFAERAFAQTLAQAFEHADE